MKYLISLLFSLVLVNTALAGHGHYYPNYYYGDHYYDSGHNDVVPFIFGAVIGGIVVNEIARPRDEVIVVRQPRVVEKRPSARPKTEPPVLINGVMMQRTLQCKQQILIDDIGDEVLFEDCKYVFVQLDGK